MNKLNILLVMPRLVRMTGDGYTFPMGIAYISSSLKAAGYSVYTLNLNHIEGSIHDILKQEILKNQIDVVATGGYSCWFLNIKTILQNVKEIKKDVFTIVGGAIVTAEPDVALAALEYADIGVIGEGELTICELVKHLESDMDINRVDGLIFRKDNKFMCTNKRDDILDLDSVPWPDYDGFQFEMYLATRGDSQVYSFSPYEKSAYIMGSRSCPYRCTFCTVGITGKSYRQRNLENIKKEIMYLKKHYGVNAIIMTDELFGRGKERVRKFSSDMKQLNMPWEASFRVDCVDDALIDILKSSTCFGLLLGIESGDDTILKSMRKGIKVNQINEALRLGYDAEIMMDGNLIFGDIAETIETARKTLKWWREHAQYALAMSMIIPYPGTEIYKYACREKLIEDPIKFLKEGAMKQINVSRMSDEELGTMTKEIIETPYKYGPQVRNIRNYKVDSNGFASFSGECYRCNTINSWQNIQLFTRARILCTKCNQKHYAPILPEIKELFTSKIEQLLKNENHMQIAIWGILDRSIGIMNGLEILRNPKIYFVDNADWKQKIIINGKKVYGPDIINEKKISTLITFYIEMGSFQQVLTYTQKYCPSVDQLIRADHLLRDFEL